MAEEPEKRFDAIMDKLFHAPPKSKSKYTTTPTNSTSLSGVQSSRGKKRPNMSLPLAVVMPKSRGAESQISSGSGGPVEAPPCRPWDRGDLLRRLATFKSMTWFAKPKVVSAVNCARRGWINVEMDIISCKACGARLLFSTPSSWSHHQVEKAALVFSLKLDNGHKLLCPWVDNSCDETLAQFPPMPAAVLVDNYKKRCSALSKLVALPSISSSTIDYLKSHELEHLLRGSSTIEYAAESADTSRTEYLGNECEAVSSVLYFQAQKLISLCGWELRSLPYVVDGKDRRGQFAKDANHLDLSHAVSHGQNRSISVYSLITDASRETNVERVASDGIQSDPNSVVFDCGLCGASVGLWAFSMVPRPAEFLRLVGFSETHDENNDTRHKGRDPETPDAGNVNHLQSRENVVNAAIIGSTSSNEEPSSLNLTIAGGPPPTKQNFRATISLPVVGRNLRARFSSDSEFRDCLHGTNSFSGSKDQDMSLEGANIYEQGIPETNKPDSIVENPVGNTQILVKDSNKIEKLPENAENVGTVNPTTAAHTGSQVEDSSNTLPDSHVSAANGETSENDTLVMFEVGNCNAQHNSRTVAISGKQGDTQDGSGGEARVQPVNHKVVPSCIGKDLLQLDKAMEFDPIRQHRHFCPWIESGNSAPGWRQTLSALQRPEFSKPLTENAPSSFSLIEGDDPIASVRRLFMSPSAKRKKLAHDSS